MQRVRTSKRVVTGAALLSCAIVGGCSSEPAHEESVERDGGSTNTSDAGLMGTDAGENGDATPPAQPCNEAVMSALQGVLDGAHSKTTNLVAAIKTPACGVRFYSSGSYNYDRTVLHRIASVSKTYTGAIVLQLFDEGRLSLDDPASKWLGTLPGGDAIQVHHLLEHRSGLAAPAISSQSATTPESMLKSSVSKGAQFSPGSKYDYQNINFVALGLIAQAETKKALPDLIHERILTTIGAHDTFFEGVDKWDGPLALPGNNDGHIGAWSINPSVVWGSGSLVATPEDVVKWMEGFGSRKFFGPKAAAALTKFQQVEPNGYFYGLATIKLEAAYMFGGGDAFGHFGDLTSNDVIWGAVGYHTQAFYFPDHATTVVMTMDYSPADGGAWRAPFLALVKALFADGP